MKKLYQLFIVIIVICLLFNCSSSKKTSYSLRDQLITNYTDSAAAACVRGKYDSCQYWFGVAFNVDSVLLTIHK